jgi:hypothetical protein
MEGKAFTLRLPDNLYRDIAARKSKSLSAYIVQAVEEKLARDREDELRKGFASLAGDQDSDVTSWMSAQQKAMTHIDD